MFSKQRSTFQFLSLSLFYFIYFRKHLNIVSSSLIIFFHLNTDIYQKKVKENERSAKTTTLSNQPTIVTWFKLVLAF